jgi:RND family efflux transporter MFP subunit
LADGPPKSAVPSPFVRRLAAASAIAAAAAATIFLVLRARIPAVEPWRVERITLRPVVAGRGTILPPERIPVFPAVIGRVARVLVAVGTTVRAGDPLIELDGTAYAAQVDEARASAALAEKEAERAAETADAAARKLARARGLAGRKIASPEYLQAVKLEVEAAGRDQRSAAAALGVARSKLAAARDALARTRVAAPASGTVEAVHVRPGETVAESTAVAEIADATAPLASVEVLRRSAAGVVVPGAAATVTAGGAAAAGTVRRVEANKTSDSPYVTVMIALSSAPAAVRPGVPAEARIEGAPKKDVLAVPVGALAVRPRGAVRDTVWTLTGDRAHRREVEIGAVGERSAEIVSGLREGETIVAGPAAVLRRLEDGARVRIGTGKGE